MLKFSLEAVCCECRSFRWRDLVLVFRTGRLFIRLETIFYCAWLYSAWSSTILSAVTLKPDEFTAPELPLFIERFVISVPEAQKRALTITYSNVDQADSFDSSIQRRRSFRDSPFELQKSVITCLLGRLADLSHSGASRPRVINQPAPSWPCYNYSSHIVVKVNTKRCACVSILKCACICVCMDESFAPAIEFIQGIPYSL